MRKSFRFKLADERGRHGTEFGEFDSEPQNGLINQLSSNAAKLFKGVYSYHKSSKRSIDSTMPNKSDQIAYRGSFKSNYDMEFHSNYPVGEQVDVEKPKLSEAELAIQSRLQRSKRKVLPSASYKAPNSEKACDDLNLDELEEIKRDNLRATLRLKDNNNEEAKSSSRVGLICSCKSANESSARTRDQDNNYCSCISLAPSPFSSPSHQQEHEGQQLIEFKSKETTRSESRASCGFLDIESELDRMFSREFNVENVCGRGAEKSYDQRPTSLARELSKEAAEQEAAVAAEDGADVLDKSQLLNLPNISECCWHGSNNNNLGGVSLVESAKQQASGAQFACSCAVQAASLAKKVCNDYNIGQTEAESTNNNQLDRSVSCKSNSIIDDIVQRPNHNSRESRARNRRTPTNEKEKQAMDYVSANQWRYKHHSQPPLPPISSNADNEHLYASIYGSMQTPSPERRGSEFQQDHDTSMYRNDFDRQGLNWRSGVEYFEQGDKLLNKQVTHQCEPAPTSRSKKSFLSKIKQMISPANNSKFKQLNIDQEPMRIDQDYKLGRWNKSATLSSKSTQNLVACSMRHLSSSRKSINIADYDNSAKINKRSIMNGFLTLGKKGNKSASHKRELICELFPDQGLDNHRSNSVDSLPSADSGLSCSNLQNGFSSEENYPAVKQRSRVDNFYSGGPDIYQREEANDKHIEHRFEPRDSDYVVVGRARAKVDCNPCAYDKEALVFKKGDVIDILERGESGTWIGKCNDRIGHFKFINVTEILDDSPINLRDKSGYKPEMSGTYITKLKITNDSSSVKKKPAEQQQSINNYKRSQSVNTISNLNTEAACGEERSSPGNCLSDSKETIMSSLEQLLFAIGLASEQVNGDKKCGRFHNPDQNQINGEGTIKSDSSASYLDVLNESGINNLDSFSSINDWQELEQIGIVDDEHQQRLLMAAKIIRQASRAAKLDFVENCWLKSKPAPDDDNIKQQETGCTKSSLETRARCHINAKRDAEAGRNSSSEMNEFNEPIYVNLTADDRAMVIGHLNSKSSSGRSISFTTKSWERAFYDPKREAELETDFHHLQPSRTSSSVITENNQSDRKYESRRAQQKEQTSHAVGNDQTPHSTLRLNNSIKQSDRYHFQYSNDRQNEDPPTFSSNNPRCLPNDDFSDDDCETTSKLTRGYSVKLIEGEPRLQKFNNKKENHERDGRLSGTSLSFLNLQGQLRIDKEDIRGRSSFMPTTPVMNHHKEHGLSPVSKHNGSRMIDSDRIYQQPYHIPSNPDERCYVKGHQESRSTCYDTKYSRFPRNKHSTLISRSQIINSKSAYDLRLDLSQFFS